MSTMRTKHALRALSALAQESRLAVFKLLVRYGQEGLPAGQISEELHVPPATLSFHLSQMTNAKLLVSRRKGRTIYYAANYEQMQGLLSYLLERCYEVTSQEGEDEAAQVEELSISERVRHTTTAG
ncbi:MAG: ArsR family transcriptional regulator [Rickettsiales bacterium]|jgi:DNA-binding transcriptional ArsR family regulator|nr:ArsR family transcriptional regulator [Rickettsiales bacterium]